MLLSFKLSGELTILSIESVTCDEGLKSEMIRARKGTCILISL